MELHFLGQRRQEGRIWQKLGLRQNSFRPQGRDKAECVDKVFSDWILPPAYCILPPPAPPEEQGQAYSISNHQIEAEYFYTPTDTTTHNRSSKKGIVFALGMITTLVVLSVFQLYRSLEVTPAKPEITKIGKLPKP